MSSTLAIDLPERSPRRERAQRRIEIVSTRSQRSARPRPSYALIAIGGLFVLFLAQLFMSIVISDGAYQISSLQSQKADLSRSEQSLNEEANTLASPQNLAEKAEAGGMVPSGSKPAFLDLAKNEVIGTPTAPGKKQQGILRNGSLVPNALLTGEQDTAEEADADQTPIDTNDERTSNDDSLLVTAQDAGAPAEEIENPSVSSDAGLPSPEFDN